MNKNNNLVLVLLIVIIIASTYFISKSKNGTATFFSEKIRTPIQQINTTNNPQNQTKLYIEEVTNPDEYLLGSEGKTYHIIATAITPTTFTYTLKFNTAVVYPGAVVKDGTITNTVSVPAGTTKIGAFTSVDNPILTFSIK